LDVLAVLILHSSMTSSKTPRVGMRQGMGQCQRLLQLLQPLLGIAQMPQRPGGIAAACHAGILAVEQSVGVVLRHLVEGHTTLGVRQGRGQFAQPEQGNGEGHMGFQEQFRIPDALRQGEELLSQFVCRLKIAAYERKPP
jgi:hypothetical protein